MRNISRSAIMGLAIVLLGLQLSAMAQEKGLSHVRIVRLSFVDGTVLVKRPHATQWAKALVNTPIQQGFTVETSSGAFAETEFENGSTARLGENSQIKFTELALAPDGGKINHLVFTRGYGTFDFIPERHDVYIVHAANATIEPRHKAQFRVDLGKDLVRVEVFKGSVNVQDPNQHVNLGKDKVLEYDPNTEEAFNISHGIQTDAWDKWVDRRQEQDKLALNDDPVGMNSPVYGWADLDEYGEWAFFPGYGYGWSPFVPMGWTPFTVGMWSWYSGMGYTWISAEPWGWLPFHYGYWNYDPGFGYFWMPGPNFNTFYPGLVDWYSGAGYVGWAAMGAGGRPVCNGPGCVTVMRPGVLHNGTLLTEGSMIRNLPAGVKPVSSINTQPGLLARLPGRPFSGVAATEPLRRAEALNAGALRAGSIGRAPTALIRRNMTAAPRTVLMGETRAQVAAQEKDFAAHHDAFGHFFSGRSARPLQARMGNTIGGGYAIRPGSRMEGFGASGRPLAGAPHGITPMNRGEFERTRLQPTFLPHRSMMGYRGSPALRMQPGGGIRTMGRIGGVAGPEGREMGPAGGIGARPAVEGHPMASAPAGGHAGGRGR